MPRKLFLISIYSLFPSFIKSNISLMTQPIALSISLSLFFSLSSCQSSWTSLLLNIRQKDKSQAYLLLCGDMGFHLSIIVSLNKTELKAMVKPQMIILPTFFSPPIIRLNFSKTGLVSTICLSWCIWTSWGIHQLQCQEKQCCNRLLGERQQGLSSILHFETKTEQIRRRIPTWYKKCNCK